MFFAALFGALGVQAEDGQPLTVIELFTSQGCNSCPPADKLLTQMRDRQDILALTWSVDYWDRLGWEDTMALPHNTMRQTAYNKRFGRSGLYTPQLVVDGLLDCVGSHKPSVEQAIDKARGIRGEYMIPVSVTTTNGEVVVSLPGQTLPNMADQPRLSGNSASVRLVYYRSDVTIAVGDGENGGRTLHYANVVRHSDVIGEWYGDAVELKAKINEGELLGADNVAVLVQFGYGHGPVIGAASLPLETTAEVGR